MARDPEDALASIADEPPVDPAERAEPPDAPWDRNDFDDEYYEYAREEYEGRLVEEGIRDQAEERARTYLLLNGAAVWTRAQACLGEARRLQPNHPSAALTMAITAAELLVRFMLVRPLVAGLVFHDALAERLARETFTGPTVRDRNMLPVICAAWEIGLEDMEVEEHVPLWPNLKRLWKLRDDVIHRGERADLAEAEYAVACVEALANQLIEPFARRLAIEWPPDSWNLGGNTRDPLARPPDDGPATE